jgi:hypothetical protein
LWQLLLLIHRGWTITWGGKHRGATIWGQALGCKYWGAIIGGQSYGGWQTKYAIFLEMRLNDLLVVVPCPLCPEKEKEQVEKIAVKLQYAAAQLHEITYFDDITKSVSITQFVCTFISRDTVLIA